MTLDEIKKKINSNEYSFLHENEHLGDNLVLIGLGGSHAYGTETVTSDLDIRGCTLNTKEEILTNKNFEQFENKETDTVIYSFNKLVHLLSNCNPNTIEILGLKPEHYLYLSPIGEELLEHKKIFLSKRAVNTFGGYAVSQLRRLDNKSVRTVEQSKREKHILGSINNARLTFAERYFDCPDDAIKLYIDEAVQEGFDTEIFMDIKLTHYPLRDYKCMWSEMNNIVKDYSKIGKRNKNAIERGKLGKHMMHLIRLYLMCIDILENEEIITYREKEHDLLMSIRNEDSEWLVNSQPTKSFMIMVDELESKMNSLKEKTMLPDNPDYNAINKFVMSVNERVVSMRHPMRQQQ